MGVVFVITDGEFRLRANFEAGAVAVVPWRRRMDDQFGFQLQLGDAAKIFPQYRSFDFQLMLVTGVLIVAASAGLEIRTIGLDSLRRWLQDFFCVGARESRLFFYEFRLHFFSGKNERQERSFAASVLVGGQAGEAVSAIDQFFDR